MGRGFTRRRALASLGGTALAVASGGVGFELARSADDDRSRTTAETVPFYGGRQSGIATAAQDRLVFAAFDVTAAAAGDLRELLRTWTAAAAALTEGRSVGPVHESGLAPPLDTGEALGLPPSRLTITFGLGPTLFERDGRDRFGLAERRPAALRPLGPLPGELLDPERSDGDLCVQACADDPQVAFHAVRNLARLGRGSVQLRWLQLGFGRTSATTRTQATPRNLHGFKDGTNNLKADDADALGQHVWVADEEPQEWLRGGTYLVCRRIRMYIETWDRASLDDQEQTIGRHKLTGAPFGGRDEHDPVRLEATGPGGSPVIPANAHIRLAAPATNGGVRILRRGYSYTDGIDPRTGQLDAGLFFVSFQNDPERFARLQRRLGVADALTEYVQHTASGLFAIPPGTARGGHVADAIFA